MHYKLKKQPKEAVYGEYPCNDYLNNALRFLMQDDEPNKGAVHEICYCISKANGRFADDVKSELTARGLLPWE